MRELNRGRPFGLALVLVSLVVVTACSRAVRDGFDDAAATTRVMTAILNDPEIGARGIDVATRGGVVTLSGVVWSQTERQQAVALARRVDGVAEVKDALQVAPPAERQATAAR